MPKGSPRSASEYFGRGTIACSGVPPQDKPEGPPLADTIFRACLKSLLDRGEGIFPPEDVEGDKDAAYSIMLGVRWNMRMGGRMDMIYRWRDLGTLIHDSLFRKYLRKINVHPLPLLGTDFITRMWDPLNFKTTEITDGSQSLARWDEQFIFRGASNYLHAGESGYYSLVDYPLVKDGSLEDALKALPSDFPGFKRFDEIAANVGYAQWVFWHLVPTEYREAVGQHEKDSTLPLGPASEKFQGAAVPSFDAYCRVIDRLINQGAKKQGIDATDTLIQRGKAFAAFLRQSGVPGGYPANLIQYLQSLLQQNMRKGGDLGKRVELAYQFLIECCRQGIFYVSATEIASNAGVVGADHPILLNYLIRYSDNRAFPNRRRDKDEDVPVGIIGNRLDKIFTEFETLDEGAPAWSEMWREFLETHANHTPPPKDVLTWLFPSRGEFMEVLTLSGLKFDTYRLGSYRFLVNYIGGQLVYFRRYVRARGCLDFFKEHGENPVAILRFSLEIAYVLALWFMQTGSLANRNLRTMVARLSDILSKGGIDEDTSKEFMEVVTTVGQAPKHSTAFDAIRELTPGPAVDDATLESNLVRSLRVAFDSGDWFAFCGFLDSWSGKRDAGSTAKVRVGHLDCSDFFTALSMDSRFLALRGSAALSDFILYYFYRSCGVYVSHNIEDYISPLASPTDITTNRRVLKKNERDETLSSIGSSGRLIATCPEEVLKAVGSLGPGTDDFDGDGFPVRFRKIDPNTDSSRITVWVPREKEDGACEMVQGMINPWVWEVICGRLNLRSAHYILNNGDAARMDFESRAVTAEEGTEATITGVEKAVTSTRYQRERSLSPLRDVGNDSFKQSERSEQANQRYFKTLGTALCVPANLPELALWLFKGIVSGDSYLELRHAYDMNRRGARETGGQMRNRFDEMKQQDVGLKINRKLLRTRLGSLCLSLKRVLGLPPPAGKSLSDSDRQIIDVLEAQRKRGVLHFFDPVLFSVGHSLFPKEEIVSKLTQFGVFSLSQILDLQDVLVVIMRSPGAPLVKAFDDFAESYPSIIHLAAPWEEKSPTAEPESSNEDKTGADSGEGVNPQAIEAPLSSPSLEELVLAVCRSLVIYYEQLLLSGKDDNSRRDWVNRCNYMRVRALRAAYFQEYFNNALGNKSIERFWQALSIPPNGLAAPLSTRAMPPDNWFIKVYGGYVSRILGNENLYALVLDPSIAIIEDDFIRQVLGPHAVPFSSFLSKGFGVIGRVLYHVIGTMGAFLKNVEQLTNFVQIASKVWATRNQVLARSRGEDLSTESPAPSLDTLWEGICKDLKNIKNPFADLQLEIDLSAPKQSKRGRKPLPMLVNNKTRYFIDLPQNVDLIETIKKSTDVSTKIFLIVKLKGKPLSPKDNLVTKHHYLPEVDVPLPEVIAREKPGHDSDRWTSKHQKCLENILSCEKDGEDLLNSERTLERLVLSADAIDARRRTILFYLRHLNFLNSVRSNLADDFGRINEKLKELRVKQSGVDWQRFLEPLGEEEQKVLSDIYSSTIVPKLQDKIAARQAFRGALLEGIPESDEKKHKDAVALVDDELTEMIASPIKALEHWKKRIEGRLRTVSDTYPEGLWDIFEGNLVKKDALEKYVTIDLALRVRVPFIVSLLRERIYKKEFMDITGIIRDWMNSFNATGDRETQNHFNALTGEIKKLSPEEIETMTRAGTLGELPDMNIYTDSALVGPDFEQAISLGGSLVDDFINAMSEIIRIKTHALLKMIDSEICRLGIQNRKVYRERNYYRTRMQVPKWIGKKQEKFEFREVRRRVLRAAWEAALQVPEFKNYYLGEGKYNEKGIYNIWRLPRRLHKIILANKEKARVYLGSFLLVPPEYPAKHIIANIQVKLPRKLIKDRDYSFLEKRAPHISGLAGAQSMAAVSRVKIDRPEYDILRSVLRFNALATPDARILAAQRSKPAPSSRPSGPPCVLAFDINQFLGRRTFAPAIVCLTGKDFKFPLKDWRFPVEDDARLQGTSTSFIEKVRTMVLDSGTDGPFPLRQPNKKNPYHMEVEAREADFLDLYSAVEFYRAVQASHAEKKANATRRKRRILNKKAEKEVAKKGDTLPARGKALLAGRPASGRAYTKLGPVDGARLRRKGQARLLDVRASNLRITSLLVQARKIMHLLQTSHTEGDVINGVAFEKVSFDKKYITGFLAYILFKMPKNFLDFKALVDQWIIKAGLKDLEDINWSSVRAAGTSTYCRLHNNMGIPLDARFSVDFAQCPVDSEILDRHANAAERIGMLHPFFITTLAEEKEEDQVDVDEDAVTMEGEEESPDDEGQI